MDFTHLWTHKTRLPMIVVSSFFWVCAGMFAMKWLSMWNGGQLTPGVDTSASWLFMHFSGILFMSFAGIAFSVYSTIKNLRTPIYAVSLGLSFICLWMIAGD